MKLHKGAPDFRVTLLNDVVWSSEQLLCHSSTHVTWCCLKLAKYRFWWWIQKAQVTGANTLPVFFMSDFAKNLTSLPAVFLVAHRCTWVSKMSGLNSRMATCSQRGSWLPTGSEECIASVQSLETQFCWCGLPRTSSRFVFPKSFNHGLHRGLEDYRLGSYALWCRSWRTRTKFGSCLCLIGFWRGPYSHPGNVFVQQVPGGKNAKEVRPVLLDWGFLLAKWLWLWWKDATCELGSLEIWVLDRWVSNM